MITSTRRIPVIGQIVEIKFEDLNIYCKVLDVKIDSTSTDGSRHYFIEPLCGNHRQWINGSRIINNLGSNCKKISNPSFLTVKREVDNQGYYLPDTH